MSADVPLIEARGLSKRFGGTRALIDVSLAVRAGSVHGLVGENGAGKSTLGKVIAGLLGPDSGDLLVDGEPHRFSSPTQALRAGIAMIGQEISLVPKLSIMANVMLGIEPRRFGLVDKQALRREFTKLAKQHGFDLSPTAPASSLRLAEQQEVEVLRAIAREARVVVMDEPSATLTKDARERMLEIIRRLAASGQTVLLISHFLEDVLDVCDTVTVMRDGRVVRTGPVAAESVESLVMGMVGRAVELAHPPRPAPTAAPKEVLTVRGLIRRGVVNDVSFSVNAGEIVGIAGLVGSGRTEVARAIVGADSPDAGEILLHGQPVRVSGPRAAARNGIVMLPESRKDEGLMLVRSVRENMSIAYLGEMTRWWLVQRRRESAVCAELMERLDVRGASLSTPVDKLSGGNQQKVLFARWLLRQPTVFIADEPTRGVDVGAKAQIHELMRGLAAHGVAVLVISSELEEVLALSHRVLVMRAGRLVRECIGDEATSHAVMSAAFEA